MTFLVSPTVHLLLGQSASARLKSYVLSPGFTVSLPGKPKPVKMPMAHPMAGSSCKTWVVQVNGGAYILTVIQAPQGKHKIAASVLLKAYLKGVNQTRGVNEVLSRPVRLYGYPGMDTRIYFKDGNMTWQRTFAVNNTIYQVAAESSPPHPPMPLTKDILESMRIPKASYASR